MQGLGREGSRRWGGWREEAFSGPWEFGVVGSALNDKGSLESKGRPWRVEEREEEGQKGGEEAARGLPSAAALSSPAKPPEQ